MINSDPHPFEWLRSLPFWADASASDRTALVRAYSVYTFGAGPAKDALDTINRVQHRVAPEARPVGLAALHRSVRYNGAMLKDFKVYAFGMWCASRGYCAHGNVPRRLIPYLRAVLVDPTINEFLLKCYRAKCRPMTVRGVDRAITDALNDPDTMEYFRKFIFKKMTFIMKRGTPFAHILSELQEAAIFNLLRVYPHWTDHGHMIAVAKNAGKRRGHNFIKERTTQSRQEVTRNEDGSHAALILSLDPEVAASVSDANVIPAASLNGSAEPQEDIDNRQSVRQLLKQFHDWRGAYLRLLTGEHNEAFSEFIGGPNDELLHSIPFADYSAKAALFLGIPRLNVDAFYAQLKGRL